MSRKSVPASERADRPPVATPARAVAADAPAVVRRARLAAAVGLSLCWALPLFFPPGPLRATPDPGASFLARVFPAVPPAWVLFRLCALAAAGILFALEPIRVRDRVRSVAAMPAPSAARAAALAIAAVHAACVPWVRELGSAGQSLYLSALALPALVLALPSLADLPDRRRVRAWLPVATLLVVWCAWRLLVDVHSPRGTYPIDTWRAFVGMARYAQFPSNVVTGDLDPDLPGVPASPLFFQGLPLFRAGLLPLGFGTMQVLHIGWIAFGAAATGAIAAAAFGRPAAAIAVAVVLFAPFDRFIALDPAPYVVGPIYTTALPLAALVAYRRRSEAALALMGAVAGVALSYPSIGPTIALVLAATLWSLRGYHRRMWVGWAAAVLSFVAAVAPNPPYVATLGRMAGSHFQLQGQFDLLEGVALGQLPVAHTVDHARAIVERRPLDIVTGVVLAPVASPRTSLRLWGDAIFDPAGTILMVVGLAACVRALGSSAVARLLVVLLGATMAPAFVSNVDRPNLMRALALPLPVALLAATGFDALARAWGPARRRRAAVALVAAIACGGTWLFDVVNPRILSASSLGVMFGVLDPADAHRALVVDHPEGFARDTEWLFTGVVAAYGGPRPVGYLRYEPALPDVTADGKDLLFWSPGLEYDVGAARAVCARWPGATLFDVADASGLAHLRAARLTARDWTPAGPPGRWRASPCS